MGAWPPSPSASRARMTGTQRRAQLLDVVAHAVRREGLRRHERRGDRRPRRGVQARRLRALRRQGGHLRGRRRPRDPGPDRRPHGGARGRRPPARCWSSGPRSPCSTYIETSEDGLPHPRPRLARRPGDRHVLLAHRRRRHARSSTCWPTSSASAGRTRKAAPMYAQMLVGMVALTGQWWLDARQPGQVGGRGAPGQPRVERAVGLERRPQLTKRLPDRPPAECLDVE